MTETNLDRSRRQAMVEVERLLGIVDETVDQLLDNARGVLGSPRADRCLELARLAPLSSRWVATSAIAELVVGTRDLGQEGWTHPHQEFLPDRRWVEHGTPDAVLSAGHMDEARMKTVDRVSPGSATGSRTRPPTSGGSTLSLRPNSSRPHPDQVPAGWDP